MYNGTAITHDAIGNPLNDGTWTYTWSGRQLTSMTDGTTTWNYKYNADGLRTEKTDGTTTYKYVYSGSTLVQMQINSNVLSFGYDGSTPVTVTYNDTTYYYVTNLQGDIVSILDGNRTEVVKYTYDAWGNILSTTGTLADTLGQINPLRYRGYVYDQECNLYYLQSRYYDPSTGRFLNADSYPSTGQGILGNNMFAYCGNNPVNRVDYTGQLWSELLDFLETVVEETGKAMTAMAPAYVGCGEATLIDGPLPVADTFAAVGAALITVGLIGYGIYQAAQIPTISIPKTEKKTISIAISKSRTTPTVIYRHGGTNPGNLTPKKKDMYSGLSFSTVPMPGSAMTTIEALNATGVVYAIQDSATHVSVRPVGATVEDWINAGSGSIWTQAVKSVVVKYGG